MKESSSTAARRFKSPVRVVIGFLWRSRERLRRKIRERLDSASQAHRELQRLTRRCEALEARERTLVDTLARLERERWECLREVRPSLPVDPSIGDHGYGARMIELSVRLAQTVGLRSASAAMKIFFAWLGVEQPVPHFTTIRIWLQRLGVAAMQEPVEMGDDWIWMADHSNQIGQEKILVVLSIRASHLPPPGKTLRLADLHVLAVRPGQTWKREDVRQVYEELAQKHGVPRAILTDGAVELRESAAALKNQRADCLMVQDFKHKAANFLEGALRKDQRFAEFTAEVGKTRAAIQQTELAHLTPPGLKTKARFMNLGPLLIWGQLLLWLLRTPAAKSRRWATPERLEAKLGWVQSFASELAVWDEYRQVIERGLKFINTQGVFHGGADQLRELLHADLQHIPSRVLADRLVEFVRSAESQVKENERLPLSTEILESSFARYKHLEGQHSKGGFTSLIAAFPALLLDPTPTNIKRLLAKVSTTHAREWVRKNIQQTVTSKRAATYQEMKRTAGRRRRTVQVT